MEKDYFIGYDSSPKRVTMSYSSVGDDDSDYGTYQYTNSILVKEDDTWYSVVRAAQHLLVAMGYSFGSVDFVETIDAAVSEEVLENSSMTKEMNSLNYQISSLQDNIKTLTDENAELANKVSSLSMNKNASEYAKHMHTGDGSLLPPVITIREPSVLPHAFRKQNEETWR
jgi:hypothetical protein